MKRRWVMLSKTGVLWVTDAEYTREDVVSFLGPPLAALTLSQAQAYDEALRRRIYEQAAGRAA